MHNIIQKRQVVWFLDKVVQFWIKYCIGFFEQEGDLVDEIALLFKERQRAFR